MFAQIFHGLLAVAQTAVPAAPPATTQARFDAANVAASAGDCKQAVALYDLLAPPLRNSRNRLFTGAVAVRKGGCLVRLDRVAEGEALLREGLPALEGNAAEFAEDLRGAYMTLGNIACDRFDYAAAAGEFRRALAMAKGRERIAPLLALSRVLAFDHDGKALAHAEEARALAQNDPGLGKDVVALVQTRYARVLLNEGRKAEALAVLKDSLRKQGGLDQRVTASEVATRGDLALAALLNGQRDQARMYLAYTGAGRMNDSPFSTASDMAPAPCGGATGLKPEDVAVVEFSLGENGVVRDVTPIYTTGGRAVALAFAQAVGDWSWTPQDAAKIPPFWRQATRIEMRCSRAAARPPVTAPLAEAFATWIAAQGGTAPAWEQESAARALPIVQALAARARAGGTRADLLQALAWLAGSGVVPEKDRIAAANEATAVAQQMAAPVPVTTYVAMQAINAPFAQLRQMQGDRRALLARPEVAADPLAAATLRMVIVNGDPTPGNAETGQLVDAVVNGPLPDGHPLKVAALLKRADRLARAGQTADARATFRQTGLSGDQCALIAPTPTVQRQGANSSLYPREALNMGFEGWAQTEFDIAADGRTVDQRTVAAYPPFVFGDAAKVMLKNTRYQSSYRPDGDVACSANKVMIRFNLPQ